MKKCIISFILGAIIFTGIGIYAETKISASQITYGGSITVKDKIDSLYTIQENTISQKNNTITNLESQITSLNSEVQNLESQIDSQNSAVTVSFNVPTSNVVTKTVGFRPTFISCIGTSNNGNVYISTYNEKYSTTKAINVSNSTAVIGNNTFFTINDTGFTYNFVTSDTSNEWYDAFIYCTVSK